MIVSPSASSLGSDLRVMGSSMVKVDPWPGCEVTMMVPPCSAMILRETGSPRPVPREPLEEAKI